MTRTPPRPSGLDSRRPEAGFTLMEMVVSLAIFGVLLVSMGSAILIASRAVPASGSRSEAILDAAKTLGEIGFELQYAQAVTERTDKSIEFKIPDQWGNSRPVRYAWSGTPGDPLTREYNGGSPSNYLDSVQHFSVASDLRAVAPEGTGQAEGAERLLVSHDDTGGEAQDRVVESDKWPGQYFRPVLPPEAVGWRITRVKFKAKQAGSVDGFMLVQLRTADGSCLPTDTVLDQDLLAEMNLTSGYLWQEISFPGLPALPPGTGAALVMKHIFGGQAAWVRYEKPVVDTPDAHYVTSLDRGDSWTQSTSMDMLFYVYGTIIATDAAAEDATVYHLTGVRLALQIGTDSASRVETGVQILSQPEVSGP